MHEKYHDRADAEQTYYQALTPCVFKAYGCGKQIGYEAGKIPWEGSECGHPVHGHNCIGCEHHGYNQCCPKHSVCLEPFFKYDCLVYNNDQYLPVKPVNASSRFMD